MKTAILASIIALIIVTCFTVSRASPVGGTWSSYQFNQDQELRYLQNQKALNEQRRQTEIMEEQLKQQEKSNDRQKEEDFKNDLRRVLENN